MDQGGVALGCWAGWASQLSALAPHAADRFADLDSGFSV